MLAEIVDVNVEAVTLLWPETVSCRIVDESGGSAVLSQVHSQDKPSCDGLEKGVEAALSVLETFVQVIDGIDSVGI